MKLEVVVLVALVGPGAHQVASVTRRTPMVNCPGVPMPPPSASG